MVQNNEKNQYLATFTVNIISVCYGASAAWPSSSFLLLESVESSPLCSGALTKNEMSWIASILCIGGFIGTILSGILADFIGRKYVLCFQGIPSILSWILIYYAENPIYLYVSRFLSGLACGGAFILVPLFVSEIAENSVRGALGSLLMVTSNVGILLSFMAGHYLSFRLVPAVFVVLPTLFLLLTVIFPETPIFLLKTGKLEAAESSLRFYRNIQVTGQQTPLQFQEEFENLKRQFGSENGRQMEKTTYFLTDFTEKVPRKSFIIGIALILLHEFCGCFTMINYTATIFAESGSNISPNLSAIICGAIQLLGTLVSTKLVDRAGRKFLLIVSSFGAGISLVALGTYTYLNSIGYYVQPFSWVAIASFSSMLFLASCGIIPLPYVILSEVMPHKIRSIGATVCFCFSWTIAFLMLKYFPIVVIWIGMHGCIFFFAACCFLGAIFVIVFLPETKGRSFEDISRILAN
ncbi:Facilitated trehalose transporter Tret1 [Pseudolycoriella hygida]|uniref:Facilitated trehalose transporter Tret1 n=1 Tax=Pseudolycoriella hygida TaxID=35572 RepID=A0A9Q0SA92_9DIPT|nr:Facilitated trehalose transporter Tret1 [Pseudolycoriella hygida]